MSEIGSCLHHSQIIFHRQVCAASKHMWFQVRKNVDQQIKHVYVVYIASYKIFWSLFVFSWKQTSKLHIVQSQFQHSLAAAIQVCHLDNLVYLCTTCGVNSHLKVSYLNYVLYSNDIFHLLPNTRNKTLVHVLLENPV